MHDMRESGGAGSRARSDDRRRLLVVDQDRESREALQELLVRAGFRVVSVSGGQAAAEALASEQFEAMVLDVGSFGWDPYRVPKMVAETISSRSSVGQRPLLIAVGVGSRPTDHSQALRAGYDYHLTKPLRLELLLETLSELFH